MVKEYLPLLIGTAVFGGLFLFAWKQGYIAKLSAYVGETQQELKKCNWPSRDELANSTLLIFVVIGLLGVFTVVVDQIMITFVKALLKAS
jgi:preprotein translocase SecE subunit